MQRRTLCIILQGVNRPENNERIYEWKFWFAGTLLKTLEKHKNTCPVMLSSSIQATLVGRYADGDYWKEQKGGRGSVL